jgi:signal transduction histidine kinase
MNAQVQTKGLSLTTEIAPDMPATLWGDAARVQQIVVNLVSNAIKFTQKGEIQVCIYQPDPVHWALQVSDTGAGIPAEAQSYIFEPFQQVDGSITREHRGTGLGLSIVKQLTELMEGQVILVSETGKGSTFKVVLPFIQAAPSVTPNDQTDE